MAEFLDDVRIPLNYNPILREYNIPLKKSSAQQAIFYCPWSGTKLPKSVREEYFRILEEEYNIDSSTKDIPKELKSDIWWKKRKLQLFMKQILARFIFSEQKYIEIYFPDSSNKINYFYKPTEKLHKFDEVMITYFDKEKEILLHKDTLDIALLSVIGQINKSFEELDLPPEIQMGQMVYALNESKKEYATETVGIYKNIDFSNYWVWSTAGGAQTFIYTFEGSLYLEIGKIYQWQYDDNDIDLLFYQEFMKNYKPIAVEKISKKTAQQWLEQCTALLKQIE
jgi:hypothetical protein